MLDLNGHQLGRLPLSPHMKADQILPENIAKWSFGINATIEPRSEWKYNIFHNASYVTISILNGRCEILSHNNTPKMRSFKFKNEQHLIEKLTAYFKTAIKP
jgi:hypothetical protein